MKKILIAEDEHNLASILSKKLANAGFDVTVKDNGKSALEEVSKGKYDLLILDMIMPEKTGMEVLKEMHAKKIKTPVIAASNLNQQEVEEEVKGYGVSLYLVKSEMTLDEIEKKVLDFFKSKKKKSK